MEKQKELLEWKNHLRELMPVIVEQIDWIEQGEVKAFVNPECPEKLRAVAERLVEIQNSVGEYQRNQILKEDIERIKYFSKTMKLSFDDVVKLAVSNSRYVSKDAIEAKGVVGFILEIQSVYNQYYKQHGVFPINAMSAEVKRACRNFKTDVSLTEKIEAIIEVFLPELKGINIAERDYSIVPQTRYELSEEEISSLVSYFKSMSEDGRIDKCFEIENKESFEQACKILAKARISLDEFLKKWAGLTYTKCYSADIVPATKQMVLSYKERFKTTRKIRENDPYLRSKIDAAERCVGRFTLKELLKYMEVPHDNDINGRNSLTLIDLSSRESFLIDKLKELYPKGIIEKDFIKKYPALYEELKLLSNRIGGCGIDKYLRRFGFVRESFHSQASENVIYLSERDMSHYGFFKMPPQDFEDCRISELNPRDYFGVYNKLISQGLDGLGQFYKHSCNLGE